MSRYPFFTLLLIVTLAASGLGCGGASSGPPVGTVTGTIKLNGEPVPGVNVVFVPEGKGSPSYGGTDDDGVYHLMLTQSRKGAEVGKHQVTIQNPEPETDDSGNPIGPTQLVIVPAKYNQPGTLTADVTAGHNTVDFELRK